MDNKELERNIAKLETKLDMLEAELSYLNQILTHCGFPNGIVTLKTTVEELLSEDPQFIQKKYKL